MLAVRVPRLPKLRCADAQGTRHDVGARRERGPPARAPGARSTRAFIAAGGTVAVQAVPDPVVARPAVASRKGASNGACRRRHARGIRVVCAHQQRSISPRRRRASAQARHATVHAQPPGCAPRHRQTQPVGNRRGLLPGRAGCRPDGARTGAHAGRLGVRRLSARRRCPAPGYRSARTPRHSATSGRSTVHEPAAVPEFAGPRLSG